jgi:tetratricopeptide (TPR) repeat protein
MKNLQKSRIIFLSLMAFIGLGGDALAQPLLIKVQPRIAVELPSMGNIPALPTSPSINIYSGPDSCKKDDSQCVVDLVERLKNSNNVVRRFAAWQLGGMRKRAIIAVPNLIEMLNKDPIKWERINAAMALGKISVPLTKILPALRIALNDSDKDVANTVATTIGEVVINLGNEAKANSLLLSESERNIIVSELEASLKILQNPRRKFASQPIERVKTSLFVVRSAQTQKQRSTKTEADKLRKLAVQQYQNDQIQQALLTANEELKVRRQINDTVGEISALNFIALIHDYQSKYPRAMEHLQLALTTLDKANISADFNYNMAKSEILFGVASVYASQGEYDKALEIARQIRVLSVMRIASDNTTSINNTSSATQSARDYIKADADMLYKIAVSQFQRDKIGEALRTAETVLKLRRTAQDKIGEDKAIVLINSIRQQMNKP